MCGITSSTRQYGAIPAKLVQIKGDGTTAEAGDLEIVPGFRLAGEVRLSDGHTLPQPARLTVGRRDAWDSYTIELGPDGKFDLTNMPPESITVGARIKGYRHSGKNKSLDRLNPFGLAGKLSADKTNLVILLEPGEMLQSEWNHEEESQRAENRPLSGIEDGGWVEKRLHGLITDEKTGEPIRGKAQVRPGYPRARGMDFVDWQSTRAVSAEDGRYEINLPQTRTNVVLQILAEDYAPHLSKPLPLHSTNQQYNVTLAPAKSPSGILLNVHGKPAEGVKMYILGPMEQGYLSKDGELSIYQLGAESECITDAGGRVKFAPKLGEAEIFAATREGFVRAPVKDLPEKIQLQQYGKVRGRLMRDGKPVAEEMIDLSSAREFNMRLPHIGMHGTITDQAGRFEISTVPPGQLRLTRREKMEGFGGWTNVEIKKFESLPGSMVDLGDVEYPAGQLTRRR